jgi:hypothetical protein
VGFPQAAVTTLTQNVLGSGVLALPFAMCSAGIFGGSLAGSEVFEELSHDQNI